MPGIDALKRSSFASASSRRESRTFTRTGSRSTAASSCSRAPPPGGRGSTPRPGRAGDRRLPGPRMRVSTRRVERAEPARRRLRRRPRPRAPAAGRSDQAENTTTTRVLGQLAQLPRDGAGEQRRLADPARAVQHGQPRGDHVRDRRSRHRARDRRTASRRSPCRRTASAPCTGTRGSNTLIRSPFRRDGRRADGRTRSRPTSTERDVEVAPERELERGRARTYRPRRVRGCATLRGAG